MHDEHIGPGADHRDRREIAHRIVRQLAVHARIDRHRAGDAEEQRIAVGRRFGGDLGADDGAGAGPVVDDNLLPEHGRHFRREHARDDVAATAGSEGHDEFDGLGRISLGTG